MKILKNCVKCNHCGEVIESRHRHDYVRCSCGAVAVDGGKDYFRRICKCREDYLELSEVDSDDEEQ